jgi:predicted membrane protein (TIGR00267 family)
MLPLRKSWRNLKAYDDLVGIGEIARRYFAMNAFDGVLTMIGVLMGNLAAGVVESRIVLTTGLATAVAMGVSGLWGAYLTETAERQRELDELSQVTLTDLNHTRIGRASHTAVVIVALVDGLSPLLASLIVLLPFFAATLFPTIIWAYFIALGMALLALFGLGVFLGHISRRNRLFFGIKTIAAGIVSILISFLLRTH